MKGVYQHCGKQHPHRYLAEFDFHYNHRIKLGYDDAVRTTALLKKHRWKTVDVWRSRAKPPLKSPFVKANWANEHLTKLKILHDRICEAQAQRRRSRLRTNRGSSICDSTMNASTKCVGSAES